METDRFITEWVTDISRIHLGEFSFLWSSKLAKLYLKKAKWVLNEVKDYKIKEKLLVEIENVSRKCDELLDSFEEFQRFKSKAKTVWIIQKVTKAVVLIIALREMNNLHKYVSIHLQEIHSEISRTLRWQEESFWIR